MKLNDYTNGLLNRADTLSWQLNTIFHNRMMWFICLLKDISIGKGCVFYGKTKFKRARTGSISVGNHCTYRSSHTSNLIGINRPCIVTALEPFAIVTIGNNCGFSGTVIGCFTSISIGNNVRCGANTLITDSDWHLDDPRAGKPLPIVIEDNVWLGVNVTVLKGITIGKNSVIGAGSVVTRDIPANVIAAGNPCKIIKEINN